ncbi:MULTISPECIES: hypothetical protein [Streptomyces]|uniref:hypothetical protein n=1 Tax=Streptomyces TaxID=1883 RepID=UPI00235FA5C5|nr:hypothetical protein [Streptomyces sp. MMBL 11-1]
MTKGTLLKLTTAELLEKAAAADRIAKERDRWKGRAVTAERQLNNLRNLLRPAA